jgi:ectoine hydroxylase-related dioxygenase (phytanoyl-CoA dioxygenase family)
METLRRSDDPYHIQYQDIIIELPYPPIIETILEEAILNISKELSCSFVQASVAWTIIHGINEQTYPHTHCLKGHDWAFVYWAQVPEGSGILELYPMGMHGPTIRYQPVEGEYLFFPGRLLHGVRHNTNPDLQRVSFSTNFVSYTV